MAGAILAGYLQEMLLGYFGWAWLLGGSLSVSFRKPIFEGDEIVCSGAVRQVQEAGEGWKVEFDVSIRREEDGPEAVVGQGSLVLASGVSVR